MTLQEMLDAMNSNKSALFIHSSSHNMGFHANFEFERSYLGEGFKLRTAEHLTLLAAVEELYEKFVLVTEAAFKDARPAAITYEAGSEEVVEIAPPPPAYRDLDDEVPF